VGIEERQIAIENRIDYNLYMGFRTYSVQIGQELTSGDEIWCGRNDKLLSPSSFLAFNLLVKNNSSGNFFFDYLPVPLYYT
jgi:hypothetical protein